MVAGSSYFTGSKDFSLTRYNSDGSVDSTFGSAGNVSTDIGSSSNDEAKAIAIQSDQKVLVAGTSFISGTYDFAVVRYNSNGTLDTSFGTAGKVTTDVGVASADYLNAMVVQADGKILVSGEIYFGGVFDFAVVRYNSNGTLDTSFGTGGKVTTDLGSGVNDLSNSMAVQADGKILLAGNSTPGGFSVFALVRYNTNGALDMSFGTAGKVFTDVAAGTDDVAYSVAIQSDGKILLAGHALSASSYDLAVVRYNTSGSLDATFGSAGKVTTDTSFGIDDFVRGMAMQSDGKILITGYSFAGNYNSTVARYTSNGVLDTSFGTAGVVTSAFSLTSDDLAYALAIQNDGQILLAGVATPISDNDFALVRLPANGR